MHIPDGFIDATTSLGAGAAAAAGMGVAVHKTADVLEDRQIPMAGLVAAFVFAAQMLNFPVAAGTSGHLLGGVLAAILVGPWAGALCLTVVLMVQALFADGGVTALGLNVVNVAFVTVLVGYPLFRVLAHLLPRTKAAIAAASGIAAGASVVASAAAFTLEFALGGSGGIPVRTVGAAMLGVHSLVGIGEGVITGATVALVLGARPDLVYGVRDLGPLGTPSSPLAVEGVGS